MIKMRIEILKYQRGSCALFTNICLKVKLYLTGFGKIIQTYLFAQKTAPLQKNTKEYNLLNKEIKKTFFYV